MKISISKYFSICVSSGNVCSVDCSPLVYCRVTVIADDCGQIKFYDADFKLLYWCRHLDLGVPITSICPNAVERRYKILKSLNESELELTDDDIQHKDIIYEPLMPRDFTIDENPLIVRDFLISTLSSSVDLVTSASHITQ